MKFFKPLNNRGFAHVELFVAALVIIGVGAVGAYVLTKSHADTPTTTAYVTDVTSDSGSAGGSVHACKTPTLIKMKIVVWAAKGTYTMSYFNNGAGTGNAIVSHHAQGTYYSSRTYTSKDRAFSVYTSTSPITPPYAVNGVWTYLSPWPLTGISDIANCPTS